MNAKKIAIVAVMIALIVVVGLLVGCQTAPTKGPAGDEYMGGARLEQLDANDLGWYRRAAVWCREQGLLAM